jgi:hypothetical protein
MEKGVDEINAILPQYFSVLDATKLQLDEVEAHGRIARKDDERRLMDLTEVEAHVRRFNQLTERLARDLDEVKAHRLWRFQGDERKAFDSDEVAAHSMPYGGFGRISGWIEIYFDPDAEIYQISY